jgi:hypothetical protein
MVASVSVLETVVTASVGILVLGIRKAKNSLKVQSPYDKAVYVVK